MPSIASQTGRTTTGFPSMRIGSSITPSFPRCSDAPPLEVTSYTSWWSRNGRLPNRRQTHAGRISTPTGSSLASADSPTTKLDSRPPTGPIPRLALIAQTGSVTRAVAWSHPGRPAFGHRYHWGLPLAPYQRSSEALHVAGAGTRLAPMAATACHAFAAAYPDTWLPREGENSADTRLLSVVERARLGQGVTSVSSTRAKRPPALSVVSGAGAFGRSAAQLSLQLYPEPLRSRAGLLDRRAGIRQRAHLAPHVQHVEDDPQPANSPLAILMEVRALEL
jgi:hypothetical protein